MRERLGAVSSGSLVYVQFGGVVFGICKTPASQAAVVTLRDNVRSLLGDGADVHRIMAYCRAALRCLATPPDDNDAVLHRERLLGSARDSAPRPGPVADDDNDEARGGLPDDDVKIL